MSTYTGVLGFVGRLFEMTVILGGTFIKWMNYVFLVAVTTEFVHALRTNLP